MMLFVRGPAWMPASYVPIHTTLIEAHVRNISMREQEKMNNSVVVPS